MSFFTKKDLLWASVSAFFSLVLSVTVEPYLEKYSSQFAAGPQDPPVVINDLLDNDVGSDDPPDIDGPELPRPCPSPCFEPGHLPTEGTDTRRVQANGPNGEEVWMDIAILDREHYWPIGRADVIMNAGNKEADVFAFLNSTGLQASVEQATDIIAIGMASCEIAAIHHLEEERARSRADQLISWVRTIADLSGGRKLYSVNLGRFKDPDCSRKGADKTREQRNVMLVAVLEKINIDSPEALSRLLRKHLYENDYLEVPIANYSLNEFHLRPHS